MPREERVAGQFGKGLRARTKLTVYASLAMIPSVALAYYIALFGVNVVFWDEWDMVPLLERLDQGKLSVGDLFAQHNEHRPFFPNLLNLVTEKLTGFNTVAEAYLGWILLTLTAVLLLYVFWAKSHKNPKVLLFFIPASFLLFSFRQTDSILWGYTSLTTYLLIFSAVATFTLLEGCPTSSRAFILALLTATVASFSTLEGLLVWPLGLFQILMRGRRKNSRLSLTWIIAGSIVTGTYFYGWTKPSYLPSWEYVVAHPFEGIAYLLSLVGAPFSFDVKTASVFGLALILVLVVVLRQAYRTNMLRGAGVFLSLIFFGALSTLASTIGRSGFGVEYALSSRYTPVTSLGIVGLYLLAITVAEKSPSRDRNRKEQPKSGKSIVMNHRIWIHVLLAIFLIGLIVAYSGGWQEGANWRSDREMNAYVLKTYQIQSDETIQANLYPPAALVRAGAQFLEQNSLNVFRERTIVVSSLSSIGSDTYFNLDTINRQGVSQTASPILVRANQEGTITITGWAVDKQANATARAVFIIIDGQLDLPTLYGVNRPDVAAAYGTPHFEYSGFIATFSSLILAKGRHTLSLEIVASNGPYFYYEQNVAYFVLT